MSTTSTTWAAAAGVAGAAPAAAAGGSAEKAAAKRKRAPPKSADPDREMLLNELFSSFADFSEKAAQIFRDLSSAPKADGATKKKGGKGTHPKQKKLSGYQIFANNERPRLKAAAPEKSFGAISQTIGAMWKEMSAAERQVYSERAASMDEIVRTEAGSINVAATILMHEQNEEAAAAAAGAGAGAAAIARPDAEGGDVAAAATATAAAADNGAAAAAGDMAAVTGPTTTPTEAALAAAQHTSDGDHGGGLPSPKKMRQ
eukprot:SAG22_NODE_361_length_11712_cov_6.108155_11_plen_259_part_00